MPQLTDDSLVVVRDPVVVNVSYFFSFVDDPTIDATGSDSNVQRGAALLYATAEFRKQVITGQLPYERVGKRKTPICATAYKYMFNACRIPQREQDSYRIYDPSVYTHCIVARKGHFFAIQMVHPTTGNPLPVTELEDQLRQCITLADSIPSSRPKLGLMTSGNRDDWADARQQLVDAGGMEMEKALEKLQSGVILLNLDNESPVSRQELGDLYWTGGLKSGENRCKQWQSWFDCRAFDDGWYACNKFFKLHYRSNLCRGKTEVHWSEQRSNYRPRYIFNGARSNRSRNGRDIGGKRLVF